ncbi:MAG: D-alanyl-D-alanine carboxypeptidase [SAR324 cluster bacterium]|nr:D-alanyl-D-alanine carboxypeptidase [SAR324 cluster bacterium]
MFIAIPDYIMPINQQKLYRMATKVIIILVIPRFFLGLAFAVEPDWTALKKRVQPHIKEGVLLIAKSGEPHFHYTTDPDKKWIPASTLKVPLALYALDVWGEDHHFQTEVYLRDNQDLLIRGLGDPFFVSEEIQILGGELKGKIPLKMRHLLLDNSAFTFPLQADGVERSSNPYDALNGALLVNFNTASLEKKTDGTLTSAEKQTPLTPLTISLGKQIKPGKQRINLAQDPALAQRYSGELMKAIWKENELEFTGGIKNSLKKENDKFIFQYKNSKSLKEILRAMLKYSNNFIANQILLSASLEREQSSIDFERSIKPWKEWWQDKLGVSPKKISLVEASGISRKNWLSEKDMLKVLELLRMHPNLLSEYQGLKSKTGSLKGIYSLVGYAGKKDEWEFVLFLEQEKNTREKIAKQIFTFFSHVPE